MPVIVLSWAQSLPVIPGLCCTPGVFFPYLSETYKHKYKACYFSMTPPSPKHAVLVSHGVSFGGSLCFTGCKLQDKMKILRGCSSGGFQQCGTLQVKPGCFKHAHAWMSPVTSTVQYLSCATSQLHLAAPEGSLQGCFVGFQHGQQGQTLLSPEPLQRPDGH